MFKISISDQGQGMPPEYISRVFDPYFTTKGSSQNLGLGLAYCKNVVRKHGGTLKARSAESKGTTIIIRLPANRALVKGKKGRKE